jgi:Fe-Mn family superoxide dismutase
MDQSKEAAKKHAANDAQRASKATTDGHYEAKQFDFSGVEGLSQRTLETHRSLYEGYVKETNALLPLVKGGLGAGESTVDRLNYDGLVRRFAFEHNGMVLHELFFDVLRGKNSSPRSKGAFADAVAHHFGSYEAWEADIQNLAKTRGVGWILTVKCGAHDSVNNMWVEEHHLGVLAESRILLAIDLWEHAYLLDFKPTERPQYLKALFDNIDWDAVDARASDLSINSEQASPARTSSSVSKH